MKNEQKGERESEMSFEKYSEAEWCELNAETPGTGMSIHTLTPSQVERLRKAYADADAADVLANSNVRQVLPMENADTDALQRPSAT